MNKLVLYVGAMALAGCNRSQPAEQPANELAAEAPAPQPTSQAAPGTYSVTEFDGTKMTMVLAGDHTYTNTVHGKRTEAGAWAIVAGRTCFTPGEGTNAVSRCYTDSPIGEDGTFIETPDQGQPMRVKRIA